MSAVPAITASPNDIDSSVSTPVSGFTENAFKFVPAGAPLRSNKRLRSPWKHRNRSCSSRGSECSTRLQASVVLDCVRSEHAIAGGGYQCSQRLVLGRILAADECGSSRSLTRGYRTHKLRRAVRLQLIHKNVRVILACVQESSRRIYTEYGRQGSGRHVGHVAELPAITINMICGYSAAGWITEFTQVSADVSVVTVGTKHESHRINVGGNCGTRNP